MKKSIDNVRIIRKYSSWLINYSLIAESTANNDLRRIGIFEDFIKGIDFRKVDAELVLSYKLHLKRIRKNGKPLRLKTINGQLLSVKNFFLWLRKKPGYKVKINDETINSFDLKLGEKNTINSQSNKREVQNIEDVKKLLNSIPYESEVDKRDRGLISFLIMTGIRVDSLIHLCIRHVDLTNLTVILDPEDGVPTKFSKVLTVNLLVWDKVFLEQFESWYNFLVKDKNYGPNDPLFPKTDIKFIKNHGFCTTDVIPEFWSKSGQINYLLKTRAKDAGLKYFNPHSYRNTIVNEIIKRKPSVEQIVAVSQSLGHSKVQITLDSYSYLPVNYRREILDEFFSNVNSNKFGEENYNISKKEFEFMLSDAIKSSQAKKPDNMDSAIIAYTVEINSDEESTYLVPTKENDINENLNCTSQSLRDENK